MSEPRLDGQAAWTATVLFVVLCAAVVFTPLTGIVVWLMPVPFIMLTVQHRKAIPVILAVILGLALFVAGFGVSTVVFTLGVYLTGWVMGEAIENSDTAFPSLITGTLVFIMMCLVGLAFLYWSGVHIGPELLSQTESSLQMYRSDLHLSPAQIRQMSSDMATSVTTALPAIIVILSFVLALINYGLARVMIHSRQISAQPLLLAWRMPPSAVWVYVVATFCVVIGVGKDSSFWWSVFYNAFILTGFLIAIEGIAFIWRRILHLRGRYAWLVVIVILAMFLNSLFILLGLLDSMLLNRRRR